MRHAMHEQQRARLGVTPRFPQPALDLLGGPAPFVPHSAVVCALLRRALASAECLIGLLYVLKRGLRVGVVVAVYMCARGDDYLSSDHSM